MTDKIPIEIASGPLAFYNQKVDKIYYDKDLDLFPSLKEKILAHEQRHADHRNNYFFHAWNDFKDYLTLPLSEELHEFQDHVQATREYHDHKGLKWWHYVGMVFYTIVNMVIQVLMVPSTIFGSIRHMFIGKKR